MTAVLFKILSAVTDRRYKRIPTGFKSISPRFPPSHLLRRDKCGPRRQAIRAGWATRAYPGKPFPKFINAVRRSVSAGFRRSQTDATKPVRRSVRSEIFVATHATPIPKPVPPSFHFGAAGGAAYSAVAALCQRRFSSVLDRRYRNNGGL